MNSPHMGEKGFPHGKNINVYSYENEIDYTRFNAEQMSLQLCTVPWDMGEAHVGQRVIEGVGHVVFFKNKDERNAWFDKIPDNKCIRFETKYRELHSDLTCDIPVPFDSCNKFNYLVVKYNLVANNDSPLNYEFDQGKREWFYFVREFEMLSPSTTRLHLLADAWQTWIYDVDVTSMFLERGHAPLFASNVNKYFENPLKNSNFVRTEDVNFGEANIAKHIEGCVLNEKDMYICFVTSASPMEPWAGSKNDPITAYSMGTFQSGVPNFNAFCCKAENATEFIANAMAELPQLIQTIQGVFFAPEILLDFAQEFNFLGITCHLLQNSEYKELPVISLNKDMFQFDEKYSELTKLYTYPYSKLVLSNENGETTEIHIEDTNGKIKLDAILQLTYPFISIQGNLRGIGGDVSTSIEFRNINKHTFSISGNWYDNLQNWDVPIFALVLPSQIDYETVGHYPIAAERANIDRTYQIADRTANNNWANTKSNYDAQNLNDYASANATAEGALGNVAASRNAAINSANATQSCENANAATSKTNADVQIAANTSIQQTNSSAQNKDTLAITDLARSNNSYENGYTNSTTNSQIDAAYNSAAISAASGVANSAVSGLTSGASAGPAGAVAGVIGGLVTGGISAAATMAQNTVAANLTTAQAGAAVSLNNSKTTASNNATIVRTNNSSHAEKNITEITNTSITSTTDNTAATIISNATIKAAAEKANANNIYSANAKAINLTETTTKENADRTKNTAAEIASRQFDTDIANAQDSREISYQNWLAKNDQSWLQPAKIYGENTNGDTAISKPQALFAHVVTQNDGDIANCGDEFLRYGYMLNRQWSFNGDWTCGHEFCYWKVSDFFINGLNVPDAYMDMLRFLLFGGVTIWAHAENIGNIDIYSNKKLES